MVVFFGSLLCLKVVQESSMIATGIQNLVNTHVIENKALRDHVVIGLDHVKRNGLLYLDENILHSSTMNSSVIMETYSNSEELGISRRVINELQLWNFTSVLNEYTDVFQELVLVFGPANKATGTGGSIATHLPKAGRAVNQAINYTSIGIFWLFDFLNRAFDYLFQIVLFYLTLYGCLLDEKGLIFYFSRVLSIVDRKGSLRYCIDLI
jgi:hypothetical protein